MKKPKLNSVSLTDVGNASRFSNDHGAIARYCYLSNKWIVWTGTHWSEDDSGEVFRLARKTVRKIYRAASQASDEFNRKAIADHAKRSESQSRITSMVSLARSEPGLQIKPFDLDQNPILLNCLNGTFDLETGQLKEHNKDDFITRVINVGYDPDAVCPTWEKVIGQIFLDDPDLISYFQRAVGYTLTGLTNEQVMFILFGKGGNGKSTIIEVLRSMLGPYTKHLQAESLMTKKFGDTQSNDIAALKGIRLATSVETEEGQRLAESKVKQLTGGDTITARKLYQEFIEFRPHFKLWLACNHRPTIRGTDAAIWRRIHLIPFEVTFSEDQRDQSLLEKLEVELPGILAWSVRGCMEWKSEGLNPPSVIRKAIDVYRSDMDVVSKFLEECCREDPSVEVSAKELYGELKNWSQQNGEITISQQMLGRKLSKRGFKRFSKRPHGKVWRGLELNNFIMI